MALPLQKQERSGLIRQFLSGLSFPKLFLLLLALFALDTLVIDPLPFIDEAILGTLAVMFGMLKRRRENSKERARELPPPRET